MATFVAFVEYEFDAEDIWESRTAIRSLTTAVEPAGFTMIRSEVHSAPAAGFTLARGGVQLVPVTPESRGTGYGPVRGHSRTLAQARF